MRRLHAFAFRLRALVRSRQMDREFDDEIASHLAEATEEYVRQGLPLEEARRAARRSFGAVARTKEVYREARSFTWAEEVPRDLRYALRTLRRSPAFAATAVVTLGLAIGANTTMFSVVNAVVLRPLPYASPDRLAMLWTENPRENLREGRSALWDVEQWRTRSRSFADMATFDAVSRTLTTADGAEQIAGASISPNLLPLLGVAPVQGRTVSDREAEEGQRLVLISHRFWQARFAGAGDALGATIVLDGGPARIAGILPAGFQVARLDADIWETHRTRPAVRGREGWFVVGRLRPDVTIEQARVEMSAIGRALTGDLPAVEQHREIAVTPLAMYMVGAQSRLALWFLGGAVFCVFIIAAANVTSLSLARSVARAREMSVRAALGANAGRIVRQLLTESVLLAALAGALGTLLALGGIRFVRRFGPANLPRLDEVSVDPRVLLWALGISLLAGILVGLAPAWTTLRRDLRGSGETGGRNVSGGAAATRIRRALVVAEFALAIVLLVGAGLLLRSWWNVRNVDPAFRTERVLMIELSAPAPMQASTVGDAMAVSARRIDLYDRVLAEIQAVPGVQQAGLIGDMFISNPREHLITVEGHAGSVSERVRLVNDEASANLFTTLGTPLLRGRFFASGDGPAAPRVAIINDAMARRSWPRVDPVGRRFKFGGRDSDQPWYTIVGVVADMRLQGQERDPVPQIFQATTQTPPQSADLLIRTSTDHPEALAGAIRAAIRRAEKHAPIYGVTTLDQRLGAYLAQRRFQMSLLAGFAGVALLMAAIGIYGLIQYSIAARTQEIGLRMAIGAQAGDIFRMVIREGLTLSLIGAGLGLIGAWWLGRAASSLLFGVTPTDPLTSAVVSLLLTAVAAAACYFPARRAMRVDPIVALKVT
jgi:putative ABC transport system permease protein